MPPEPAEPAEAVEAARFVCGPCQVDVEVRDPAHLPVVAALHRAVCHPFEEEDE